MFRPMVHAQTLIYLYRRDPGYPPDHINAVITHTIHFLGLLTFYLGVKLPFETDWTGKKFGVGQPWIGASKGGESGSWAKYVLFFSSCERYTHGFRADCVSRWTTKQPLHLTASSSPSSPLTPLPTSAPSAPSTTTSSTTLAPPTEPKASFTTAFAMLLYNVCYLAHTQSVEIPLSQAGDALGNLWAVCCSGELGRYVIVVFVPHRFFLISSISAARTKPRRVYHHRRRLRFHSILHRSFKRRRQVRQGVGGE